MIDLFTFATPNGRKVSIALEEMQLEYRVCTVDIHQGAQFDKDFLQISPNNKIPAIVDRDTGVSLMESGAILLYLAEKTGCLFPKAKVQRWECMQWLMWQMSGLGPILGQLHHFLYFNAGQSLYAEQRYKKEAQRLYMVLNQHLQCREFIVDQYSIADIAIWPWVSRFEWQGIELNNYRAVKRWYLDIARRPAVIAGYDVPCLQQQIPMPD